MCSESRTWDKLVSGRLRGLSPPAVERIRDTQPFVTHAYDPSRSPISRLERLWNSDKHRIITTTAAAIGAPHQGIAFVRTPINPVDIQLIPIRDVAEIHDPESLWGIPLHGMPVVQARITPSGPEPLIELRGTSLSGLALEDNEPLNHTIAVMAGWVDDLLMRCDGDWQALVARPGGQPR